MCFGLRLLAGICLHDSCRYGVGRHESYIVFHSLFIGSRRFHLGEHVYFGRIRNIGGIFLFHNNRTVYGGVFGLLLGMDAQR